jgi:adenylate kinase
MSDFNFNKISFVGGIHGAGKSTICRKICDHLQVNYLSASEVLNWNRVNSDLKNKNVDNISFTQDLLIEGLRKRVIEKEKYILEGHYCLLNKHNKIVKLPVDTFKLINPLSFYVIINDISIIKSRLESRDGKDYDYDLLSRMQDLEIEHATELSKKLGKALTIGQESDFDLFLNSFQNDFS